MPRQPADGADAVDGAAVRRLAELLRIEVTPDRAASLAGELTGMVRRLNALAELDPGPVPDLERGAPPTGIGPRAEVGPDGAIGGESPPLRPDRPDGDPLLRPPAEIAPDWRDGYFLVPRVR